MRPPLLIKRNRSVPCQEIGVVGAQGDCAEIEPLFVVIDKEEWFILYVEWYWFVAEAAFRERVCQSDVDDFDPVIGELLFKVCQNMACGQETD